MRCVDDHTDQTIEVKGAPVALLGLLAMGVAMTGASLLLVLLPAFASDYFIQFMGLLAALFFGAITSMNAYYLLMSSRTVVMISPKGICDTRLATELIPWPAIRNISTYEMQTHKFMVLDVDPEIEAKLTLTWIAKFTRRPNKWFGADGLMVSAQGLKIGFDDLLATSMAYAKAY
ncbi:MAG: hypothetical protein JXQ99_10320 [Hyphomicrobiaceae bacterium]